VQIRPLGAKIKRLNKSKMFEKQFLIFTVSIVGSRNLARPTEKRDIKVYDEMMPVIIMTVATSLGNEFQNRASITQACSACNVIYVKY